MFTSEHFQKHSWVFQTTSKWIQQTLLPTTLRVGYSFCVPEWWCCNDGLDQCCALCHPDGWLSLFLLLRRCPLPKKKHQTKIPTKHNKNPMPMGGVLGDQKGCHGCPGKPKGHNGLGNPGPRANWEPKGSIFFGNGRDWLYNKSKPDFRDPVFHRFLGFANIAHRVKICSSIICCSRRRWWD